MKRITKVTTQAKYPAPFDFKNLVPEFDYLSDTGNVLEVCNKGKYKDLFFRNDTPCLLECELGSNHLSVMPLNVFNDFEAVDILKGFINEICGNSEDNDNLLYSQCFEMDEHGRCKLHLNFYWDPEAV